MRAPLPSVVLHDHLDGGLRPATVLDLARSVGHELPAGDVAGVAAFFDQGQSGSSLERYLAAFGHTVAVMQTAEALERVAYEALEDHARDGVVYAEMRFAPLLLVAGGLGALEVLEAVAAGMRRAEAEYGIAWGIIVDAIRSDDDSDEVAEVVLAARDLGVVSFDLAGPESGFPASRHLPAIRRVQEAGLPVTLHAGEAGGVAMIAEARFRCGADRIGHGVDLVDDCVVDEGEIVRVGPVAAAIRDRRVPLEMCPTSNLHTRGWTAAHHPVGMLHRAGFTVTVNTDNRLMSATSMPAEFEFLRRHHGFGIDDFLAVTRRAIVAAFCTEAVRRRLWEERIAPGYRGAGAEVSPL